MLPMKVLIISDAWHPQVNGVVRTYEYLSKELISMGHDVEIIGPADFAVSIPMPFYPEIKLVINPWGRLKRIIKDFAPDKIHIATEGPLGWAARRYCIKNNCEFTTSYHTQFPDYVAKRFAWLIPPLYRFVHQQCIKWVRYFHAPSSRIFIATKSLETQLLDWGFKTPMHHLTRGVDFSVFYPATSTILDDVKRPIALYVGRISIEKNLNDFMTMPWAGTKIMVGDGPIREQLSRNYPDVHFVGKKTGKALAEYYRASDVFAFPSRTDTFGIVLIEALACGLPIAAYNVTGPKDIVTHNDFGALEETNLALAAEKAMQNVNSDHCVSYVRENYSWTKAGEQFVTGL